MSLPKTCGAKNREFKTKTFLLSVLSDMEVDTFETTEQKPKVSKNFPPPVPEYSSQSLFLKHMFALEVKRFHHSKRNKKGMFCEVI